jgi:hypothetical protein
MFSKNNLKNEDTSQAKKEQINYALVKQHCKD